MTLNLSMPGHEDLKPRITVFGVGGAGGNAVNNMIDKQLDGVEFVVANTDAQALAQSNATSRVQMGIKVTEGLGAGARASVGAAAAEESIEQIVDHLAGAHMCFITAGMGGGTGTGAAPIIAQAARELGVLTVGVVTKPFQFEGGKRMRQAEEGVDALQKVVDTLIIIPNQNLFRLANEKTTFTEAFSMADDVLYSGTVAAAMEGRYLGLPALAISLAGQNPTHYETAAGVAVELLERLSTSPLPRDMILNVNVPDRPKAEIKGFRIARLGNRHKSEPVVRSRDPSGREIFWVGPAGEEQDGGPGTDFYAISEGYVSLTPLQVDLTRHEQLNLLREWLPESSG